MIYCCLLTVAAPHGSISGAGGFCRTCSRYLVGNASAWPTGRAAVGHQNLLTDSRLLSNLSDYFEDSFMGSGMRTLIPDVRHLSKRWYLIDAEGKVLGRLATRAARLLMGKGKATYTPFLDTGDHVIIVNAAKVRLTGKKASDKMYRRHSGYPGGLREVTAADQLARHPERVVQDAVFGMLPKTKLGRAMRKKLKVYGGPDHPHEAQQPEPLSL
jgi:large subunit ribosomal protein L13